MCLLVCWKQTAAECKLQTWQMFDCCVSPWLRRVRGESWVVGHRSRLSTTVVLTWELGHHTGTILGLTIPVDHSHTEARFELRVRTVIAGVLTVCLRLWEHHLSFAFLFSIPSDKCVCSDSFTLFSVSVFISLIQIFLCQFETIFIGKTWKPLNGKHKALKDIRSDTKAVHMFVFNQITLFYYQNVVLSHWGFGMLPIKHCNLCLGCSAYTAPIGGTETCLSSFKWMSIDLKSIFLHLLWFVFITWPGTLGFWAFWYFLCFRSFVPFTDGAHSQSFCSHQVCVLVSSWFHTTLGLTWGKLVCLFSKVPI